MYTCTCCSPSKSYTEVRNLYRHQRKYDPNFIEPKDRADVAYDSNPTLCLNCETPLTRRQVIEGRGAAKYCSKSCSRQHSGSGRPEPVGKPCNHCGASFTSKHKSARFCSTKCSGENQSQAVLDRWLAGTIEGHDEIGNLRAAIRRHLIEQAGHKCSQCGWGEINPSTGKSPLNVDHIDGNSLNNSPENLRVLCPNCHSLTPTYGSLNRGNGRDYRKLYRAKQNKLLLD